ncbi:D-alanine--D-alanine ligase A [Tolypocladium ophioglossoides CBS 100239]|uniref:D-alanine--D-alanine ligase A n=1 Tax=Tolypocladium ophioglossoides (strain CBS 100239) TaxID=1163406 RepID=A0A0L0N287_TOLOC|nr:D-alanine--D-alanine ligase A [Tolypocladium ophioglossoides CBS 100239]
MTNICRPLSIKGTCISLGRITSHASHVPRLRRRWTTWTSSTHHPPRVAVLYQSIEAPIIDGTRKPKKPGGYQDSGADIAYNLSKCDDVEVICPSQAPDPRKDDGWSFPDSEDGILDAIQKGATHLWANTIVFASHPLQTSPRLEKHQGRIRVIGQGPLVVEKYDNKEYVNDLLRNMGGFTMPRAWSVRPGLNFTSDLVDLKYPVVAKPVRGRGSYGVKVCYNLDELISHSRPLLDESPALMIEQFLMGDEATVTVMPPTVGVNDYWSLPIVTRFNHLAGIAPYNGVVAVMANSRAVPTSEELPEHSEVRRECERAARVLGVTAPIRIDVRRLEDAPNSKFAMFDVNMKPNMTGPGRPGRDDQASLTLMAASALGWDYRELLKQILGTSSTLRSLRSLRPKEFN